MQEFNFKQNDDSTYTLVGYVGDETHVRVPPVYLGQPVTVVFDRVFRHHAEIRTVQLPDTVGDIGEFAFGDCTGLEHIDLPRDLRSIWQNAFIRSGLRELELPEGVRIIAPYAFKDCRQLARVVCNPALRTIYSWAFSGCDALTTFDVSPTTTVSPQAFA